MKNNDDIPTTDTNEIKQLINRVKRGELDQGDALLIEKLLNILLMIVSLLQRKHTSIRRMKELLLGMKEKKRGKDETKNRAEDRRSGADGSSQTDSPKEMASKSTCEGDSSCASPKLNSPVFSTTSLVILPTTIFQIKIRTGHREVVNNGKLTVNTGYL
jgi:hypothetical protein